MAPLRNQGGVLVVEGPLRRIFLDVPPDAIQVLIVADDVVVIVALPDLRPERAASAVDGNRGARFVRSYDFPDRRGAIYRARPRGAIPRGRHEWRPYGTVNDDDAVYVVWHDTERVKMNANLPHRNLIPDRVYDPPSVTGVKPVIFDVPQQT
jgi:hypothetical protein